VKLPRRHFLHLAAGAAVLPAVPRSASALDYPTRPVHLIAGFPPGGIVDTMARLIAEWLSQHLGQQVIVENRPGATSNIATELVSKARPDGYTLLLSNAANSWNRAMHDKLNFDFIRDLAPVASLVRSAGVMNVTLSFPAKTVTEFIAYAKANPGKVNMGSAGPGSASHVYGELFKQMTGVDLLTVHYRGGGPAVPDLISGRIQVMFPPVVDTIGYIRSEKLRSLAVTSATRLNVLPDIPPIGDFVPGYEASGWDGISAPKNTPAEIIVILNRQVNDALADPTFKARLSDLGVAPFVNSPAEFGAFIVEYTDRWAKVIREAGIKAE
jgi:tripartite-type tricarboxylate transporter receptor subunit TctC